MKSKTKKKIKKRKNKKKLKKGKTKKNQKGKLKKKIKKGKFHSHSHISSIGLGTTRLAAHLRLPCFFRLPPISCIANLASLFPPPCIPQNSNF